MYEAPKEQSEFIKDKREMEFADKRISVIHTPGHTPGSCCFFLMEISLQVTRFL